MDAFGKIKSERGRLSREDLMGGCYAGTGEGICVCGCSLRICRPRMKTTRFTSRAGDLISSMPGY